MFGVGLFWAHVRQQLGFGMCCDSRPIIERIYVRGRGQGLSNFPWSFSLNSILSSKLCAIYCELVLTHFQPLLHFCCFSILVEHIMMQPHMFVCTMSSKIIKWNLTCFTSPYNFILSILQIQYNCFNR